jgi:polyisoprenoid-binding protein YceI
MNRCRLNAVFATMLSASLLGTGCEEQKTSSATPTPTLPSLSPASSVVASVAAATVAPKLAIVPLPAADYDFDPAHSMIGFSVKHAMVSTVHGAFKKFTGAVHIDETDLSKTQVSLDMETDSIDTAEPKRDAHLKSPDFFDSKKFPKMTFRSKALERFGDGYKLTGDLTIKDTTKPVTLTLDALSPEVKDPWGGLRRGTHASGQLNRTDFGLKWNAVLETGGVMVSEVVTLDIDIELIKKKDSAAAASGSASAVSSTTPVR